MWLNYNSSPDCREKPRHAAARECYEETLGVLGSASDLAAALKSFEENNVFKVCSNPNTGHFQIQYCEDCLCSEFYLAAFLQSCEAKPGIESLDLRLWI